MEAKILEYMHAHQADLLETIRKEQKFTDATEERLKNVLTAFTAKFEDVAGADTPPTAHEREVSEALMHTSS